MEEREPRAVAVAVFGAGLRFGALAGNAITNAIRSFSAHFRGSGISERVGNCDRNAKIAFSCAFIPKPGGFAGEADGGA